MRYFVFFLLIFVAERSFSDVSLSEKIEYYDVYSESRGDLISSLQSSSPIRKKGEGYYGEALVKIDWNLGLSGTDKKCAIASVSIFVNVTYTLPKLITTNEEVLSIWGVWYPGLLEHEHGHKNIGVTAARSIENSLLSLSSQESCEALEAKVKQIITPLIEDLDHAQALYDEETDFGQKQGANIESFLQ